MRVRSDLLESFWLLCRLAPILDRLVASRDRLAMARDGLWGFPTACVGAVCLLGKSSLGLPGVGGCPWHVSSLSCVLRVLGRLA